MCPRGQQKSFWGRRLSGHTRWRRSGLSLIEAPSAREKYVAEYESPEGVYFRGPPGCFSSEAIAVSADDQRAALDKVFEQACGLFVPANKTDDVKLYVYLGSQIKLRGVPSSVSPTTIDTLTSATQITMGMPVAGSMLGGVIAGAIIDGINAGEKGNLRFYHRQPAPEELKKALMQD